MLQIENIFNVSFSKQECTNFITVCNIEKQYTKQKCNKGQKIQMKC